MPVKTDLSHTLPNLQFARSNQDSKRKTKRINCAAILHFITCVTLEGHYIIYACGCVYNVGCRRLRVKHSASQPASQPTGVAFIFTLKTKNPSA